MSYAIQNIIQDLQKVESYAHDKSFVSAEGQGPEISFGSVLKEAIDHVNGLSVSADNNTKAFEQGQSTQSIASVMASVQEANIAFQEMSQIRNKLVQAYTDIMNMQV